MYSRYLPVDTKFDYNVHNEDKSSWLFLNNTLSQHHVIIQIIPIMKACLDMVIRMSGVFIFSY